MAFPWNLLASVVASWLVSSSVAASMARRETGTKVNKQSNVAPIPVVYGERKISGTRVFVSNGDSSNTYLYIILALCEGEINSIGDIYIDDILSTDSKFDGLVNITKYVGTDTQAADQTFIDADIGWTSNHQLKGTAYLAVRLKWSSDAFTGMPNIQAVVQGRKIWTGSTTEYSTNPAWVYRDYLTNARYGKGLATSFINDTQIAAAAAQCNVLVTPYTGGTQQKSFECNAEIDTDNEILNNVKVLISGMRGLMTWANGQYGLIIEDAGSSTFSFDESLIIGGLSIQSETKKNRYNRVIATFTNPLTNWQSDQIEYPPTGSAAETQYLTEDGGTELELDIELDTVTDIYMAQDIAEIALKTSRNGLVCQFNATSEALNVSVGDIVGVTHSTPAWSAKPFRVIALSLRMDGTVSVELKEHQDSIYPWSTKTEVDNVPDTNLPNPFSVIAPTPIGISEELYITVGSKGTQVRVTFNFSAPNDAFVNEYEVEYKYNGETEYRFVSRTSNLSARIDDIKAGFYDFRVRSINSMGVRSAWAELNNQTVAGLTAPPSDISGFSVRALDGQAHISWTRITDLDVINGGYVRIRHSRLLTGATWEGGQDIGEALAGTQTHVVLPMLAGTYMAKAVDEGGRFSINAKLATTNVPNIMDFNAVTTVTESPTFAGIKDDMLVDGSVLKLAGAPRYILLESGDTLVTEAGVGITREIRAVGVIDDGGTYYFANKVDLGGIYTSRITALLDSSTSLATDLFDNRIENINDWSNFDGEPSDKLSATLEMRLTEDDPNASPTWSGWVPFLVGDFYARGYEFRVVVTNENPNYNINITALSVTVDMPDRSERAFDVTTATGGTTITFGNAFHAVPAVGVTMQDGNTGDYFRITNKSRSGFTVQCFSHQQGGSATISRSINWIATSYGKEVV